MKKFLSILLTACMMLSMMTIMPVVSSAEGTIDRIDITVPDYQPGDTYSVDDIVIGSENYYITDEVLYCDMSGEYDISDFEDGKNYTLNFAITGTNGYSVTPDTAVYVNGVEADDYYCYDYADVYVYFEFAEPLDRIDLTVPEYKAGDTYSVDDIILGSENYYIYYDSVTCRNAEDEDTSTLEDGNAYTLNLEVYATNGYAVTADTVVYINGVEADEYYCNYYADIYIDINFADPVERIDITIPDYNVGDTFTIDSVILEGDNYYLDTYNWYSIYEDADGNELTIEEGNTYALELHFRPEAGYEITYDTEIYVNGELYYDYYVSYDGILSIYPYFEFLTPIESVEVPAFPEVNVGDTVAYDIYEGEEYYTIGMWTTATEEGEMIEFEGTLEDQTTYYYAIAIIPNDGYKFTYDTEITQNGKEYGANIIMEGSSMIMTLKVYSFGAEIIDKVELTATEPADGVEIGEITVADPDANYTLLEGYWGFTEDGDFEFIEDAEGTFVNGNYYYVGAYLVASDGYAFSNDLTITVNGKEYDSLPGYTYILGSEAQLTINLGRLGGLLGDLNGDGKVNALDSAMLLKYIKAGETPAEADLNNDGKVNALDSAILLKIIKGKYVG